MQAVERARRQSSCRWGMAGHRGGQDSTGRGHNDVQQGHGHQPPEEAFVTAAGSTARLDATQWDVVTAEEHTRSLTNA